MKLIPERLSKSLPGKKRKASEHRMIVFINRNPEGGKALANGFLQ